MPRRTKNKLALFTAGYVVLFCGGSVLLGQTVLPKDRDALPFASQFKDACSRPKPVSPAPAALTVSEPCPTLVSAWLDLNFSKPSQRANSRGSQNQPPENAAQAVGRSDNSSETFRFAKFNAEAARSGKTIAATERHRIVGRPVGSSETNFQVNDYCERMARLLASSLRSSTADQDIQEEAIESTLRLIAENVAATAEAKNQIKIAQLQTQHIGQLMQLNAEHMRQILQLHRQPEISSRVDSDSSNSVSHLNQRLEPVFENLSRNNQQLEILARNNSTMQRTLAVIERKITPPTETAPQLIRNYLFENPTPQRPIETRQQPQNAKIETFSEAFYEAYANTPLDSRSPAAQSNQLRQEISHLTQRLQQLENSESDVRHVGHLEPVYNPTQALKPLSPSPNLAPLPPAESSQLPSNRYRRQTIPRHISND